MNPNSAEKRQLYRKLCAEVYIPLHAKDWWLDAVCGVDNWEVALTFDGKGKISGAYPYFIKKKYFFLTISTNPPLSVYNFIYIDLPNNPDIKKTRLKALEKKVLTELISQIPKANFFRQQLHPNILNTLPFHWANFNQYTKYTHRFEDLSDLALIHKNIQHNTRTNIKKAAKHIKIVSGEEIKSLYELTSYSYAAKNLTLPYTLEFLEQLFSVLKSQGICNLVYAKDLESGKIHSGLLTVYDEKTAYALVAGIDPAFKFSYSLNALYWNSIQKAADRVNIYDFEGSMTASIEHIFRNFGANLTPYHCVYRFKNRAYRAAAVIAGLI